MTILKDVFAELFSMFVADARLTAAILAIIAASAVLIDVLSAPPLAVGGLLLAGSLATLVISVHRAARRHRTSA